MKLQRFIFGLTIGLGVFTTSCDEILDINTDPNNPAESTPQLTLPVGQVGLASTIESSYNILGSMLAHYWTTGPTASQYAFIDRYNIRTTDFDSQWIFIYSSVLSDLEFVRRYSLENDQPNYAAIAQILQSYTYQILVDLYDKIPYDEALQGKEGLVSASFQDGDIVYDNLIAKIDEAIEWIDLSANAIVPVNDDLIYGGDMDLWLKFANTLKLKIYTRQSIARPNVAQAGIAALYADGAEFLLPADNASIGFSAAIHNENPLWQELNQTTFDNLVASNTSLDMMKDANDVRMARVYDPSDDDQFVGLDQGVGTQDGGQFEDYARPDITTVINKTARVYLLTGYESLFMQAEAAARGWSGEDDKSLYDDAVTAAFKFWGNDIDADDYIGAGDVYEYDGELETIYYQKWLAFNGKQGLEGWIEWRRTGVPALPLSVQGQPLSNKFPLRLIWPITERSANPNVPTITSVDTPVWWDTTL